MTNTLRAITRCNPLDVQDMTATTRHVLWWHSFIFHTPAIVVLHGAERDPPMAFASLHGAAHVLTEECGLRVVIDASDNSLPENAKKTMREDVIEVGPMSRSVLEFVPNLAELLSALKAADLADVVWESVGGVPAQYIQLVEKWEKAGRGDLEAVVEPFLLGLLKGISDRHANVIANSRLGELYTLFLKQSEVPTQLLEQ